VGASTETAQLVAGIALAGFLWAKALYNRAPRAGPAGATRHLVCTLAIGKTPAMWRVFF